MRFTISVVIDTPELYGKDLEDFLGVMDDVQAAIVDAARHALNAHGDSLPLESVDGRMEIDLGEQVEPSVTLSEDQS